MSIFLFRFSIAGSWENVETPLKRIGINYVRLVWQRSHLLMLFNIFSCHHIFWRFMLCHTLPSLLHKASWVLFNTFLDSHKYMYIIWSYDICSTTWYAVSILSWLVFVSPGRREVLCCQLGEWERPLIFINILHGDGNSIWKCFFIYIYIKLAEWEQPLKRFFYIKLGECERRLKMLFLKTKLCQGI